MTEVVVATESDVDDVIAPESRLFAEDSGVHERYADVEWPEREGANDFIDLLANPDAIVLLARAGTEAFGLLMAYAAASGPTDDRSAPSAPIDERLARPSADRGGERADRRVHRVGTDFRAHSLQRVLPLGAARSQAFSGETVGVPASGTMEGYELDRR